MTSIYLARGHGDQPAGRHDPGAVGSGWSEQDAADVLAPVVAADLTAAGAEAFDEGSDDPNFVGSVAEANRRGDDLMVALHWDWTGGLDVHAFHHSGSTVGKALATSIVDALAEAGAELADNPVRDRDGLYVIRETEMPAVLVELGRIGDFGDDPAAHLERLGHAVAAGILDHLDLAPPAPAPKPTTKPKPTTTPSGETGLENMRLLENQQPMLVGDDVKAVQVLLNQWGASPRLKVDGYYGSKTETAVEQFQRSRRLKVDGLVGKNTRRELNGG